MTETVGKTKTMVMAIPSNGGHVIVHSGLMLRYVRNMIGDLRGADMLRKVRIHVVQRWDDCERLRGMRGHVSIDHAVWSFIPIAVADRLDALVKAVRVMDHAG